MRNHLFGLCCLSLLLFGCDGQGDEYARGHEDGLYDGWAETCNEIEHKHPDISDRLEQDKIC